jgi:hypothetical protein
MRPHWIEFRRPISRPESTTNTVHKRNPFRCKAEQLPFFDLPAGSERTGPSVGGLKVLMSLERFSNRMDNFAGARPLLGRLFGILPISIDRNGVMADDGDER